MSRLRNRGPRAEARRGRGTGSEALEQRWMFATYIVSTGADAGQGSLREAITLANATVADDTINFAAGTQNVVLTSALPQFAAAGGALTIKGNGAAKTSVSREFSNPTEFRIFDSLSPRVTLTGMTITGGRPPAGDPDGGGIQIRGTAPYATLEGLVVTGNSGFNAGDGGGIAVGQGGFLAIRNSTVSGNFADDGGGIYFFSGGSLLMENCTVTGNSAGNGAGRDGGGIYFFGTASASPPAGFAANTLLVRNSTIVNNTGADNGGGIALVNMTGNLRVQNCTITGNTGFSTGGGIGVVPVNGTATISLENTAVSGNMNGVVPNPVSPDVRSVTPVNVNYSAVGSAAGFTLAAGSGNNLAFGADLKLGNLADNGGPTLTRHPLPGSPLIDGGFNGLTVSTLPTDQRGAGYTRIYAASADIGAVEVSPLSLTSITVGNGSAQRSQVKSLTLAFNRAVNLAAGALKLERLNTGGSGTDNGAPPTDATGVLGTPTSADGGVTWVVAFAPGSPFMQLNGTSPTGSLVDGIYKLTVDPTKVTAGGMQMAAPASLTFHRLFGDISGNKTVNNGDLVLFRGAFLKASSDAGFDPAFDFDNNGVINNFDFGQLRARFLKLLEY